MGDVEYQEKKNEEIGKAYDTIKSDLEKQITNIELRQQELQQYITKIDSGINQLQMLLDKEKDQHKIKSFRNALTHNIELISKLYDTYKEYETVKFRYFKEIDDNNDKKHNLLAVKIRQLDIKADFVNDDGFIQMMQMLSNLKNEESSNTDEDSVIDESEDQLTKNPEYEL